MTITEIDRNGGSRHLRLSGRQNGEVFLHTLAHGIEYKYSELETPEYWQQQVGFTPDLRLVVNLGGQTHLRVGRREFKLRAGSPQAGMLLPVCETVEAGKIFHAGRQSELVLFFSRARLSEWCAAHPFLRQIVWRAHLEPYYFPLTPAIAAHIRRLTAAAAPRPWHRLHQEACSTALLAEVLQTLFPQAADTAPATPREKRLARLLELLHDNGSRLTLAEMAALCHSNPTTLQRDFQTAYGQNIDQYRRLRLLEHARSLIKNGTAAETAAREAGYTNPQSFARAFRKAFGYSPCGCR
ncbi:AraC family transcriptional regulator [Neisseria leonii]|uniref:helix-turn-helix domain-containing protein n=1 Tax=Neisseria leonii TaxID=2995413 RepID=UPI00237C2D00|nr:AraC family transcriptional regulator [Neisseria sp. 3986]MDD9325265.1 AraC family transcriptional regulator [Neisseria sp. 3986]